jgi:hypothetical protein
LVVVVTLVLLAVIEGLASAVVVAKSALEQMRETAERVYTRYDAELGWANVPNLYVADMYGPGVFLRINAQGFRNSEPLAPGVPRGRVRVVCSGDSFTLGYGVSNDQAWCNRLGMLDPRLEPVNMGQGGYGTDQAYLWYRRDGTKLAHDVQIFAFITDDFARMRSATFLGYPKPVLALEHGTLVTRNIPVPHRSAFAVKLAGVVKTAGGFRAVQLVQSWMRRRPTAADGAVDNGPADPERPIVASLLESLRDLHQQRRTVLVLAYLPTRRDYDTTRSAAWRAFVRDEAARDHIPFIDLVDDLHAVPADEIADYFIQPGAVPYLRAEGHYTVRGNEFIAQDLYRKILLVDAVADRLRQASHPAP